MLRRSALTRVAFAAVSLASAAALAETNHSDDPIPSAAGGVRLAVPTPLELFTTPHAQISGTIYLERCRGTCTVTKGANDARSMSSSIPATPGPSTISEYRNGAGQISPESDVEWAALVRCMQEVYSPFNVTITDARPTSGSYHVAIIAGTPGDIGLGPDILGVAPLASDCSPQDNVISFSFANAHQQTEMVSRVNNLCWTASQESAHAFGLDHQFAFLSSTPNPSACNDPMTYRVDCGGQKFFRNDSASCGEFQPRACRCGASQNSHQKLLTVFDAGQSIVPPPTVEITTPDGDDTMLGSFVAANAGSQRGVTKVELLVNGFKWGEAKGAGFGPNGQPPMSPYGIQVPANLPKSIVDIKMRACDDLGACTDSAVKTVTHGAPCASADGCAKGQKCEGGRCFWDPAVGAFGDSCEYDQFCISGLCRGNEERQICTQDCIPGIEDACPSGYACATIDVNRGVCFFPDDGGCCSAARGAGVPWGQIAFAMLMLGLVVRPWRRRR
jgi:hypothetical protein